MVRFSIFNLDLTIEIVKPNKKSEIRVVNGNYGSKVYTNLVIADNVIFLEGDDYLVLSDNEGIVSLKVKSNREKLSEHFSDGDILLYGLDCIPSEKYEEALKVLV